MNKDPFYLHYKSNMAQQLNLYRFLEVILSRINIRRIQTFTSKIEKPGNTEKPDLTRDNRVKIDFLPKP